jgi:hypothetical protein
MNTLLKGPSRMEFYTDLRLVFQAFGGRQREFNWLITDLECNTYPPGLHWDNRPLWFSGQALTALVSSFNVQFIWGVLSGFPPHISLDIQQLSVEPYADGNRELWSPNTTIQHPYATIELVCWDSSATLLRCHDDDLTQEFRAFFPEAVDLKQYNERQTTQ